MRQHTGIRGDSAYPEKAKFYASQNGTDWAYLGEGYQDEELDLGALPWARYLKIVDTTDPSLFNNNPSDGMITDGYDVDGVILYHARPHVCTIDNSATITANEGQLSEDAATEVSVNEIACQVIPEPTPLPECGVELVKNGDFEAPQVTSGLHWQIFPSGTAELVWLANWLYDGNDGRPATANIELQSHNVLSGWTVVPANGQYAELDTDWVKGNVFAHSNSAIELYQDIPTEIDKTYTLSFLAAARPDAPAGDNLLEALWSGNSLGVLNLVDKEFKLFSYSFTATETTTRISFKDAGSPDDSFGPLVDNVSVTKDCEPVIQPPMCEGQVPAEFVENVPVSSTTSSGALSASLQGGRSYILRATGTWHNGGGINPSNHDAEYMTYDGWVSSMDGDPAWEAMYGIIPAEDGLELQVNNTFVDWGAYSPSHLYDLAFVGTGAQASFRVFDGKPANENPESGWYGDNTDNDPGLNVAIYSCPAPSEQQEYFSGMKFKDDNQNEVKDGDESGLSGWQYGLVKKLDHIRCQLMECLLKYRH